MAKEDSKKPNNVTFFWLRRDLRFHDNHGLYQALKAHSNVLPLFIFDTNILSKLDDERDGRVTFIHQEIEKMKKELEEFGSSLLIKYGKPEEIWQELLNSYDIDAAYINNDYEPYARERDTNVKSMLDEEEIKLHSFKDHVLTEANEVLKDDGDPYIVFTPYSKKWKDAVNPESFDEFDSRSLTDQYLQISPLPNISLGDMGFKPYEGAFPSRSVDDEIIEKYGKNRNYPGIRSTSRLGMHFRFGTISIREYAKKANELSEVFLNELIWRDFYQMILWHHPKVVEAPFRSEYSFIEWQNNEEEFERWCEGKTGYPIVDAGMRELNETGFMHNRVRMITASFLTKHLLINWQWGEAYFAKKLLDYELASNNGGWQWAAGCGTDAAPYFRIFNPYTQAKKFDEDLTYINKWIPELNSLDYPEPVVEHKFARERCLETYKKALENAKAS